MKLLTETRVFTRSTREHFPNRIGSVQNKSVLFLLIVFVLLIFVLLIFVEYANSVSVSGVLIPDKGLSRVYARSTGIVGEVFVEVGDKVKEGQPLFKVNLEHYGISDVQSITIKRELLSDISNELKSQQVLEQNKMILKINKYKDKIGNNYNLLQNFGNAIVNINKKIEIAARRTLVAKDLVSKDIGSQYELDIEQLRVLDLKSSLLNLEREKVSILSENSEYRSSILIEEKIHSLLQSSINLKLKDIVSQETNLSEMRSYIVVSPVGGSVMDIQGQIGERIEGGISVVTLVPTDSKLIARIFVPASSIGAISTNMDLRIDYEAFPRKNYGTFSGKITKIGNSIFDFSEIITPISLSEGHYFVSEARINEQTLHIGKLAIDLKPGMKFSANVVIDKKSIISWMIDPSINSLSNF